MANAIFPKTIQLAIYGCGQPSLPVTKAQIEPGEFATNVLDYYYIHILVETTTKVNIIGT
ncbi:unnamed protein product, partial [Adineta steineri]